MANAPSKALNNRPKNVVELLTRDVTYSEWEKESASKQRFYVTGRAWGMKSCGTFDISKLRPFFADAAGVIKSHTEWHKQVLATPQDANKFSSGWHEPPAYNQALRAFKDKSAVFFHKAAQMIVGFELALTDEKFNPERIDPNSVYRHMGIEPACYNIDKFNEKFLEKLRSNHSKFDKLILDYCNQSDPKLLDDLSEGHTVTYVTAERIAEFISNKLGETVGEIRFKPGRRVLGKKKASDVEVIQF